MNQSSLVTVNILSFNRKDELRNTLNKVYEQDYKNIEVIVVDNASSDGSQEMVEREFSSVHLIKLKKNIGIAGWNEGFKIANGEYVLVLDDDSYPEEYAIEIAVNEISSNQLYGIIAFSVFNLERKEYETQNFIEGEVKAFIGCGALIRKTLFSIVGFYSELFFIYLHEEDFCIRVIDKGYRILFFPKSKVIHLNSKKNRMINSSKVDKRRYYYGLRNILIFLFLYFNTSKVLTRMIKISIGRILFGISHGCFFAAINAILSFLYHMVNIYKQRSVVSIQTQEYFQYGRILGGILYWEDKKNK